MQTAMGKVPSLSKIVAQPARNVLRWVLRGDDPLYGYLPKAKVALIPPNPNELLRIWLTSASRPSCGM